MENARRPCITITLTNGINLDANHLAIVKAPGSGYLLVFESSGHMERAKLEEIADLGLAFNVGTWCPWCDQRISD
jgi:hypothetical protein